MEEKKCSTCCVVKPTSEFGLQRGRPRHICKECRKIESRAWYLKNKDRKKELSRQYRHKKKDSDLKKAYNLSLEQYNQMLIEQDHRCKICNAHQTTLKRALCVDHCHISGKVRGLLCDLCNRSLGLLKDNIAVLKSAIKYLEKHER